MSHTSRLEGTVQVFLFKDRCERVIRIVSDDTYTDAFAWREDQPVGELHVAVDTYSARKSAALVSIYVEPAYRRSGIAHTLLAYVSRQLGEPIRVERFESAGSPAFETLCRCLAHEGTLTLA